MIRNELLPNISPGEAPYTEIFAEIQHRSRRQRNLSVFRAADNAYIQYACVSLDVGTVFPQSCSFVHTVISKIIRRIAWIQENISAHST